MPTLFGLLPSSVDCDKGDAQIQQLRATFEALVADGKINRADWQSQVAAIEQAKDAIEPTSWFGKAFDARCSAVAVYGDAAAALQARMQQAAGQSPTTGDFSSAAPGLPTIAGISIGLLLVAGAIVGGYVFLKKKGVL